MLVPGHGALGTPANVRETREYLEDLMAAIRAARTPGLAHNSTQMVDTERAALAPRHGQWGNFESYLPENVHGIIRSWGRQ